MGAPAWVQRSISRWRTLTVRQAVIGAVIAAATIRVWCLTGVPLTITNDGVWYLLWARKLLAGQPVEWHPARTPGYPLFLAAVFVVCGVAPVGVLIAQHALGCLGAGLTAGMASRFAAARWGLIAGVLAAADPVVLGMENYVLSETLATTLLLVSAAVILLARWRGWWAGVGLGAAIGALCLVRPAFQVAAPFLVLGWAIGGASGWQGSADGQGREALTRSQSRPGQWDVRWYGRIGAVAIGFLGVTGPWLVHNARAGVLGMSSANSTILWVGVCEAGLLADDFPLPEAVRAAYARSVRPAPDNDENALQFVAGLRAWESAENRSLLARWALHSIRSSPRAYLAMVVRAVGWQLEVFPRGDKARHDEMRWLVWRLSQDGRKLPGQWLANYNVTGEPEGTELFVMPAGRGPIARYFRWWSGRWWVGLPRVVLFGAAVGAVVIAARRREWGVALVLLGTLAYVGAHAVFLLPASRYSMPCWVVWWVGAAVVVGAVRGRVSGAHRIRFGDGAPRE